MNQIAQLGAFQANSTNDYIYGTCNNIHYTLAGSVLHCVYHTPGLHAGDMQVWSIHHVKGSYSVVSKAAAYHVDTSYVRAFECDIKNQYISYNVH